jgi:Ion channel
MVRYEIWSSAFRRSPNRVNAELKTSEPAIFIPLSLDSQPSTLNHPMQMSEQSPVEIAPPEARPAGSGKSRSSVAQFLVALILMLFVAPFVNDLGYGPAIDTVLITLVLILGVLAVGRSRRTLALALVLMLPAVVVRWVDHLQPHLLPPEIQCITALAFVSFVEFQLLYFIFRTRQVNSEVLCAGISGYLLLGIMWMSAYMLVSGMTPVDAVHPGAFAFNVGTTPTHPLSQFEAYYFSFITLSTVGYGDITPLSHPARALAMTEAMTGTLYMAVLISRLVALYSSQTPEPSGNKD